jgi:hypothetical protein
MALSDLCGFRAARDSTDGPQILLRKADLVAADPEQAILAIDELQLWRRACGILGIVRVLYQFVNEVES